YESYHQRHASIAGKGLRSPVPTSHTTDTIQTKKTKRRNSANLDTCNNDETRTLPNTRHDTEDSNRIRYPQSKKQTPSRQPRKRHHRRCAHKDLRGRSKRHNQRTREKPDDTAVQERPQTSRRCDRHLQENSRPLRTRNSKRGSLQEIPRNIPRHTGPYRKNPAITQPSYSIGN